MPSHSDTLQDKKEDTKKSSDKFLQIGIYVFVGLLPFIILFVLWLLLGIFEGKIDLFLKSLLLLLLIFFPIFFLVATFRTFVSYQRMKFFLDQGFVLLEINIPKNVSKPLVAMELLLEAFHQTGGESTFIDRWIKGKTRPWFSLEMVSLEGEIHFFVWMRKMWKRHIESVVYSQYPDAEMYEVEDYVNYLPLNLEKYKVWACEFNLAKADPYPIKTYYDFDMEKEKKEEHVVDPLNSTLEFFASLNKGEYLWLQILIRAHKKEKKKRGTYFGKTDWKEEGKKIVKGIIKENAPTKLSITMTDETGSPALNLSTWQAEMVKSIERNLNKHAFDTGIRGLYISEKDAFNPVTISGLAGIFKQFGSEYMNSLPPKRGHTVFSYPWQDFKNIRNNKVSREMYEAYRLRSYFFLPYKSPHSVLSTEELATIFHIPGEASATPTLPRIVSRKGDAPSNLPG